MKVNVRSFYGAGAIGLALGIMVVVSPALVSGAQMLASRAPALSSRLFSLLAKSR